MIKSYYHLYMVAKVQKPRTQVRPPRRPSPAVQRALRGILEDIVVWRKLRGLTQAQLADRAGISVNTLRRLEGGDGGVAFESVLRILRALGVLDGLERALDPYETDVGRMRSDEQLPQRVRPKNLSGREDNA
jgi:transcriptional regulator with XRE-family HTH domain